MEIESPSTILVFWNYFSRLKYVGALPLCIEKEYDLSGQFRISYHYYRSGPFFWLFCILFSILQINTIFELSQILFWPLLTDERHQEAHQALACFGWVTI
jgi:hypothetical protein